MVGNRPELTSVIIALVLMFAPGLSSAHSSKQATEPADGAVVDASPTTIAMRFDEPMRITKVTLTDSTGKISTWFETTT
jgi:methionine-rich copper-binding protein CopC